MVSLSMAAGEIFVRGTSSSKLDEVVCEEVSRSVGSGSTGTSFLFIWEIILFEIVRNNLRFPYPLIPQQRIQLLQQIAPTG